MSPLAPSAPVAPLLLAVALASANNQPFSLRVWAPAAEAVSAESQELGHRATLGLWRPSRGAARCADLLQPPPEHGVVFRCHLHHLCGLTWWGRRICSAASRPHGDTAKSSQLRGKLAHRLDARIGPRWHESKPACGGPGVFGAPAGRGGPGPGRKTLGGSSQLQTR